MDKQKLIIAIALSILVLVGFDYLMPSAKKTAIQPQNQVASSNNGAVSPSVGGATTTAQNTIPLKEIINKTKGMRVQINSKSLGGTLYLKGARLDDVILKHYRQTVKKDSPNIVLFRPRGTKLSYFAQFGWASSDSSLKLPDEKTLWTANGQILSPQKPLTLSWDNGQGLLFQQVWSLDENYMLTVQQTVDNKTGKAISVQPYGRLRRHDLPKEKKVYVIHEGPIAVIDNTLEETTYKDMRGLADDDAKGVGVEKYNTTGGWVGITDKYWLGALIPDQKQKVNIKFQSFKDGGVNYDYQTDYIWTPQTVASGQTFKAVNRVFAGAKESALLDHYEDTLGIPRFDRAIDYGWFYFLTKPLLKVLRLINNFVGNFGVAILILTVMVRLVLFPLANKSFKSMNKMKDLQPKVKALQERYKEDKPRLQKEMMAIYKKEKVNPAAGCLPILLQIPVFFSLYKVLYVSIEMRQAPFFGWIKDLSAPDPLGLLTGFGLIDWTPPSFLLLFNIGIWPIIMGFTLWMQQKMNPAPADPIQKRIFSLLPFVFTFMLGSFPAGLVIYWSWNNTLSTAQQWWLRRETKAATPKKKGPKKKTSKKIGKG